MRPILLSLSYWLHLCLNYSFACITSSQRGIPTKSSCVCSAGWFSSSTGDFCYYGQVSNDSWASMKTTCPALATNSSLPILKNAPEYEAFKECLKFFYVIHKPAGKSFPADPSSADQEWLKKLRDFHRQYHRHPIGLRKDTGNDKDWMWLDGTKLIDGYGEKNLTPPYRWEDPYQTFCENVELFKREAKVFRRKRQKLEGESVSMAIEIDEGIENNAKNAKFCWITQQASQAEERYWGVKICQSPCTSPTPAPPGVRKITSSLNTVVLIVGATAFIILISVGIACFLFSISSKQKKTGRSWDEVKLPTRSSPSMCGPVNSNTSMASVTETNNSMTLETDNYNNKSVSAKSEPKSKGSRKSKKNPWPS